MRFFEIKTLLEAGLTPKAILKYPWRAQLFIDRIEQQIPFETVDGREVVIDPTEMQRVENMINQGSIAGSLKLKDGGTIAFGNLKKTAEFAKEGGGGEGAVSNRGDVAEGILSAALFAKLKARVAGGITEVSSDDVWAVIDSLSAAGGDRYTVNVKDASKAVVNDSIVFTLQLPEPAYIDLINPVKRQAFSQETGSAVMFANSEENQKFSEYFYLNGKPDEIQIICDGGNPAKQKISKVDIEVIVTDKLTGKRRRQRMDISLKAVAKQFGQVGMGSAREENYFEKQVELWSKFGVDLEPIRAKFDKAAKKDLFKAVTDTYLYAATMINRLLEGDESIDEFAFLKTLAAGINYFATLNTPNVILVNLKSGGYEMISFADMESKLSQVDLAARYRKNLSTPQVEVYDTVSGEVLFQVRVKWLVDEKRNYVEKGPLMGTLFGTVVKPLRKKKQ